jgi:hypothetical protein
MKACVAVNINIEFEPKIYENIISGGQIFCFGKQMVKNETTNKPNLNNLKS